MQHRNIDLCSCIASESQFFKRVFYLKQIIVITGAFCSGGPGTIAPVAPPLIQLCPSGYLAHWRKS